ncbi:hypothetical protein TrVE_jg11025 [Triparma verrucosa]|uniref:Uncharacterized protein n=1 Tax=Triparma verrucosa TaxID=1606542 RepID=A0A9W7FJ94_9STRA|nr:hypothetical protein TrVE_jg11025 [Triparma verrucosa]
MGWFDDNHWAGEACGKRKGRRKGFCNKHKKVCSMPGLREENLTKKKKKKKRPRPDEAVDEGPPMPSLDEYLPKKRPRPDEAVDKGPPMPSFD